MLVDTVGVAESSRIDYWSQVSTSLFVPLTAEAVSEQPFWGRVRTSGLASVQLCEMDAAPHLVRRTPKLISAGGTESYKLALITRGSCVIQQAGREAEITAGNFAICDSARPYTFVGRTPFQMLAFMFPRELLAVSPERMARITATPMSGREGVGWLLAAFLDRLSRVAQSGDVTPDVERAAESALSLVENICTSQLQQRSGTDASARDALALRVREYIDAHLGEPDLGPDRIAAEHFVSRRYLYKLFEADGVSVSRWIRERRLERCRRDLRNPALEHLTVTSVAARWGFTDPAHFSRVFRSTYGLSPREFRRLT